MLLSLSSGDLAGTHKNPVHHMGVVQIYYFYDSRIPSAIGDAMCGLTKDVLAPVVEKIAKLEDVRDWHSKIMEKISQLSGKEWSGNSMRKL